MILTRALLFDPEMSIGIDDRNWYTSAHLLQRGMGICWHCGNVMSVDDADCNECGNEKFFIQKLDSLDPVPLPMPEEIEDDNPVEGIDYRKKKTA